MPLAFRFIQTLAAREDEIGPVQQLSFVLQKLRRCAMKCRQLVHAVEHERAGCEVAREVESHRRVVPHHRTVERESTLQFVQ
jgi:hypothetical protein